MAKLATTIFLIVALLTFVASVVVGDGDVNIDRIKTACGGTPFPETCVSVLSKYVNPRNPHPDAVQLAELAVRAAKHLLSVASTDASSQHWNDENMAQADEDCFKECEEKLYGACNALDQDAGKIKLADVRSFLADAKTKRVEWNCDACRHWDDKKKVDEISKGNTAEKFMDVLPVLLNSTKLPSTN